MENRIIDAFDLDRNDSEWELEDHTPEWWYMGVDSHMRTNNYNGSLLLFGDLVWYNFNIQFSVSWRLNRQSHINLAAQVKGLIGTSVSNGPGLMGPFPQYHYIMDRPLCGRRDPNDRATIKSFRRIMTINDDLIIAERPLMVKIKAPTQQSGDKIDAMRRCLGMSECLYTEARDWVDDDGTCVYETRMVSEGLRDDVWPNTVFIDIDFVSRNDYLQQDLFSITAAGYHNFSGIKILCERLFPFGICIDEENRTVEGHCFAMLTDESQYVGVKPFIKLNGEVVWTGEKLSEPAFYCETLPEGLMNPTGVPDLQRELY